MQVLEARHDADARIVRMAGLKKREDQQSEAKSSTCVAEDDEGACTYCKASRLMIPYPFLDLIARMQLQETNSRLQRGTLPW